MFVAGDTETVTVKRPPGRDTYGRPKPGTAVETEVPGCLFAPGASLENVGAATPTGSSQVDTDAVVYMPAGADVVAQDQVVARGHTFQVVGDPQVWADRLIEVKLRHVEG